MRFIELYEKNEKTDQMNTTKEPVEKQKKELLSINGFCETINKIGKSEKEIKDYFLLHITPMQTNIGFTYTNNNKTIDIVFKNNNIPTDNFNLFASTFKKHFNDEDWQNLLTDANALLDEGKYSRLKKFVLSFLIPLISNPSRKLKQNGDSYQRQDAMSMNMGNESSYRLFGMAMVFYCSKCVSTLADTSTEIDKDKLALIMQGCFGAVGSGKEQDNYLQQFITLEPKMKIDAAKHAVSDMENVDVRGNSNKTTDDLQEENYYTGLSFLIKNKLFEAEQNEAVNETNNNIKFPTAVAEFSNNVGIALRQAQMVANKYPKQYKIWYEKLQKSFDTGLKEQQIIEKESAEHPEQGIKNPITGKIEHRTGKGWGTGGPNAFLRAHPTLKKITDDIKNNSTPGCSGPGGWDIFNCGPKLILKMFDILEKGGHAWQNFCDELGTAYKDISRSFNKMDAKSFEAEIKRYKGKDDEANALAVAMAAGLSGISNLYNILAGQSGPVAKIVIGTNTFNTVQEGDVTKIQQAINQAKESLSLFLSEETDYQTWKEKQVTKQNEELAKKEKELKQVSNKNTDTETQAKPIQNASYKPSSLKQFINEEIKDIKNIDSNDKSRLKKIDLLKKDIDDIKKGKKDKTLVKLDQFVVVLSEYENAINLRREIGSIADILETLFNNGDLSSIEEPDDYFENSDNEEVSDNDEVSSDTTVNSNTKLDTQSFIVKLNPFQKLINESNDEIEEEDGEDDVKDKEKTGKNNIKKIDASKTDDYSNNKGNRNYEKQAKALLELYNEAGSSNGKFNINIDTVRNLSNRAKLDETLKTLRSGFKSYKNFIENLNIIPIKDGLVKIDSEINPNSYPGAFEIITINKPEKKEEKPEEKKEEKPEEKKEEKLYSEKLIEYSNTLDTKYKEEFVKNFISNLTDLVKGFKDDSSLDAYAAKSKELDNFFTNFRNEFLVKLYKNENSINWINDLYKRYVDYNYPARLWYVASTLKYVHQQLTEQIKKVQEQEKNQNNTTNKENTEQSNVTK